MTTIDICEVGPRDGLQSEPRIWSVDERIELIDRLSATGVKRIEAVSFVNPRRVPQMAAAEDVMAGVKRPDGVTFVGLALNLRGVERAIGAGVDEVRYAVVASETFNRKNQGSSIDDTLRSYRDMAGSVTAAGLRLSAVVAAAFGCPFEGEVALSKVTDLARVLVGEGAQDIYLADTIGAAVPNQVAERIAATRDVVGGAVTLGCHLHNTRNTGFANAVAAVQAGVRLLDSSVGGIGGCPFAPRATGNIATEDLCFLLRNMGYETGVDVDAVIEVARWAETSFDAPLPGQVMKAGLFPESAKLRQEAAE
ncbi:MAG: hydroxymethylglutaryl-CoA lyase [Alphaproteobacteria bacterium]|nr:hydroxymethylglutaryl-CoA lyase [Alphaproteobacteria bacterium]